MVHAGRFQTATLAQTSDHSLHASHSVSSFRLGMLLINTLFIQQGRIEFWPGEVDNNRSVTFRREDAAEEFIRSVE